MQTLNHIFRSHPASDDQHNELYAEILENLATCVTACTVCADACLAEKNPAHLRNCIRADLDCAEICSATMRVLARNSGTDPQVLHGLLHACIVACQACADECESHADEHEHCRLCGMVCRQCQERCNFLLGETSSAGIADETHVS